MNSTVEKWMRDPGKDNSHSCRWAEAVSGEEVGGGKAKLNQNSDDNGNFLFQKKVDNSRIVRWIQQRRRQLQSGVSWEGSAHLTGAEGWAGTNVAWPSSHITKIGPHLGSIGFFSYSVVGAQFPRGLARTRRASPTFGKYDTALSFHKAWVDPTVDIHRRFYPNVNLQARRWSPASLGRCPKY